MVFVCICSIIIRRIGTASAALISLRRAIQTVGAIASDAAQILRQIVVSVLVASLLPGARCIIILFFPAEIVVADIGAARRRLALCGLARCRLALGRRTRYRRCLLWASCLALLRETLQIRHSLSASGIFGWSWSLRGPLIPRNVPHGSGLSLISFPALTVGPFGLTGGILRSSASGDTLLPSGCGGGRNPTAFRAARGPLRVLNVSIFMLVIACLSGRIVPVKGTLSHDIQAVFIITDVVLLTS